MGGKVRGEDEGVHVGGTEGSQRRSVSRPGEGGRRCGRYRDRRRKERLAAPGASQDGGAVEEGALREPPDPVNQDDHIENVDNTPMKIFIIDIDGTICENIPNELGAEKMRHAKPFNDSIKAINTLYDQGNYICF